MTKVPQKVLLWRKKQKPGSIMEPGTFREIVKSAKKKYGISEERASKVAGSAYWDTVKKKFKGYGMPK